MDDIKELEAAIKEAQIKAKPGEITANRGRLIRKIREELAKAKNGGTPEEKAKIAELEELLSNTVTEHKDQLSGRYKKEFVEPAGSLKSTITALPKGIALAVQKVATCISSIKDAKNNKERLFSIIDTLKSAGLLAATPLIFTGKFMVKHWYLVVLFTAYLVDLPRYLVEKTAENFLHGGSLLEDFKETIHDKEELKKLAERAGERLKDIPGTLKKDFEGAKNIFIFLKENSNTIRELLSFNDGDPETKKTIIEKIKELTSEKDPIDLTDPEKQKEAWDIFKKLKELIPGLKQNSTPEVSPVK